MTVLITGGLGHVGSWTAYNLAKSGKKVVLFDTAIKHFDSMGLDFLDEVRDNIILEYGDVMDFASTIETFRKYQNELEGVVHTVSMLAVPEFNTRPLKHISLNTMGTLNVLEAARIFEVKKFVNTSSGAVYGDTSGDLSEDTPYKATDIYGATKISSELFALKYGEAYGMDVRSARVYFIYGPGKKPSSMYPLYKGLFGPLEGIYKFKTEEGADQFVDFTHVKDVAQGMAKLYQAEATPNRIYNISSGVAITMGEIVESVKKHLGKDTGVTLGPGVFLKRGAPLIIDRARRDLGYDPKFTDIKDGIEDYDSWIRLNGSK